MSRRTPTHPTTNGVIPGGFTEIVKTTPEDGACVKHTAAGGETYIVNVATGEKVIPGSRRPDGTMRKPIKIRPGYVPLEERRTYQTRQNKQEEDRRQRGIPTIPGLTPCSAEAKGGSASSKPKKDKGSTRSTPKAALQESISSGSEQPVESSEKAGHVLSDQLSQLSLKEQLEETRSSDPSKRLRNVRKKLSEIASLEAKISEGLEITVEQREKIGRKTALVAEEKELEAQISGSSH